MTIPRRGLDAMKKERTTRTLATLAVIAFSLPLGACTSSQLGAVRPLDNQASGGALITVENHNTATMRIYIVRETSRIPLGPVETLERRTFTVPTSILGHTGVVRLQADPIGSAHVYNSRPIPAGPGDRVTWRIAHSPALSTHSVQRISGR